MQAHGGVGDGGVVAIAGGAANDGIGGRVAITGGRSTKSTGGAVVLSSGPSTTSTSGAMSIVTADAVGERSGDIRMVTGAAKHTGAVTIGSGDAADQAGAVNVAVSAGPTLSVLVLPTLSLSRVLLSVPKAQLSRAVEFQRPNNSLCVCSPRLPPSASVPIPPLRPVPPVRVPKPSSPRVCLVPKRCSSGFILLTPNAFAHSLRTLSLTAHRSPLFRPISPSSYATLRYTALHYATHYTTLPRPAPATQQQAAP